MGTRLRGGRRIGAIGAVAAILTFGVGWPATAVGADGAIVHTTYDADADPTLRNPERGLFATTDSLAAIAAPGDRFIETALAAGTTAHVYVDLSAYYVATADGVAADTTIPADEIARYDTAFAKLRAAGLKVILRFSYTPHGTTVCGTGVNPDGPPDRPATLPDAPVSVILDQIQQVSDVLNRNADVIASFEAGFLGEFGEWHCSVNAAEPRNGTPIDTAAKDAVIAAERQYFPDRTIEMRYPADIAALSSTERIGSHQDCYASSANDEGTWPSAPDGRRFLVDLVGRLGETDAVSATVCAPYPERVDCTVALDEMPTMHFSLFADDDGVNWLDPYHAGGCWDTILASLGYRLTLLSSDLPSTAEPGGSIQVSVALDNSGFAAMFNPRPVYLVLSDDAERYTVPLDVDARSWAPGDAAIDQVVTLPQGIADGDYAVSLWLPDAADTLAADPAYAVRFANVGTWQADTGLNRLGRITVGHGHGSGGGLPATGADVPTPWLVAGAGMLLAGVVAVAVGLRRSRPGAR